MASNIKWKRVLSFTWLALTLSLLHLGLGTCLSRDCHFAENQFLPYMLILSFPGGSFLIVLVGSFGLLETMEFPVLWVVLFAGGYLQWFWLLPKITSQREILTLQLGRIELAGATAKPKSSSAEKKRMRPLRHHDRMGRTPLERALKLRRY